MHRNGEFVVSPVDQVIPIRRPAAEGQTAVPPWMMPAFLVACALSLYLQVFILPASARVALGDQSIYLHHAARMVDGQLIYRDYDHFTLPGTDVVYWFLFRVFGVRAWIPQMMLVILGTLSAWLCTIISRTVMQGMTQFLPGLLFVTVAFSSYLDASHHWYSTVASLAAVAIVMEQRTANRLALAGIFWGLATWFGQSMVLGVVGFAAFLFWQRKRNAKSEPLVRQMTSLVVGYCATVVVLNAYFVWKVGWAQFIDHCVVFVLKYYPADSFNTWRVYWKGRPAAHAWANWPDLVAWPIFHALIPLAYLVFYFVYRSWRKRQPEQHWDRLMLLQFTGVALFLTIAAAPAYNRLCAVSAPAFILMGWFTGSSTSVARLIPRLLWMLAIGLLVARPIVTQARPRSILDLPTGRTAFFEPVVYDKIKWVSEHTRPSDYFFGDQLVCFTLRLKNPGRIPFLRPTDYTRPEEVTDLIRGLQAHQVKYVGWYHGLDIPLDTPGNNLAAIVAYLQVRYQVVQSFSNQDTILERRP
jgi:hypothetical protein